METLQLLLHGFSVALTPENLFLCATGVAVPLPDPAPGGDAALWRTNWLAAAHAGEALAARLRDAGFDMIRLGAIPTGESSIQGNFTLPELYDLFIHACKANGLRIWAEVMHPATRRPATAGGECCSSIASSQRLSLAVVMRLFQTL